MYMENRNEYQKARQKTQFFLLRNFFKIEKHRAYLWGLHRNSFDCVQPQQQQQENIVYYLFFPYIFDSIPNNYCVSLVPFLKPLCKTLQVPLNKQN